jgi:hypothetical protein
MQLCIYATNLEDQFMEFKWQGKKYNVYGSENRLHPQQRAHKYSKTKLESRCLSIMEEKFIQDCFVDNASLKGKAVLYI